MLVMAIYQAKKENPLHGKIIDFLRNNPKGLTMTQIVRGTMFSRKAIEKHLEMLILENEIYMKQFGVTKVYYPNHRIQHFDFERLDYNNRTIWFDVLENEFGKYLLIQKNKKVGNEWVHENSITLPLEQTEKFLKIITKILHSNRMKSLINSKVEEKLKEIK